MSSGRCFAWAVLVAGAFALSFGFDDPLPHYPPGAALWPRIIQGMMTAAAIVLLVSRFLPQTVREEQAKAPEYLEEVPDDLAGVSWRTVAVFVMPLVWAYAMHKMGFLLVTPVFLVLFTWLMGVTRWRTLLGFGVGFYAVLVLVFYKLIFTPLPMGAGMFPYHQRRAAGRAAVRMFSPQNSPVHGRGRGSMGSAVG